VTGEAAGDAETDTPPAGTEGEAAAADWSDEPIALPPIGGAELALELTVDSLKFQDIEIGETALDLGLADNVLTADLKRFQLYDGEGNGRLKVSAGSDGLPRIEQQFALSGLQAKPFLQAAADFDRLEGTATAEFDLATTGGTERQLVQNLNGKGRVLFADGAISGINIAAMVRNAGSAFLDANAGEARKTDFAELSGSFQVTDGVVANDNLVLQAPAARIGGSGKVDLPARQIDYRIEPKAAATLEGQGGAQDVSGILVPVIITGSLDDPKFTPDLAGLAERALEDPEALKEQIKQLEDAPDQIKKRLEELGEGADAEDLLKQGLGRALGGDAADEEGGEEAPAKLLRNLLGK
jgi:AsmA protein